MGISVTEPGYKSPSAITTCTFLNEPKRLPANNGINWIKQAWAIFKTNPGLFIGWSISCILLMAASNFAPPSSIFLTPFLIAGFVSVSALADQGETLEFGDLFKVFKSHTIPLLTLGVIVLAASVVAALVLGIGAAITLQAMNTTSTALLALASAVILAGTMIMLLAMFSVAYAPCLILFQDMPPKKAFKKSVVALLVNWKAMTLYGMAMLGLYILATIPAGLGLLVLWPLTLASTYTSYRDMFES